MKRQKLKWHYHALRAIFHRKNLIHISAPAFNGYLAYFKIIGAMLSSSKKTETKIQDCCGDEGKLRKRVDTMPKLVE